MVPSKSSGSRRSSILKPPKPRQPLQSVNLNSTSSENSPATTKLKRRVSFAEKKHVKEFCNSVEQGTVWDNTYEEHDLSNFKASYSPNQDVCASDNIHQEDIPWNELSNKGIYVTSEVVADINEEQTIQENVNNEDCDLNFTNPVETLEPILQRTESLSTVSKTIAVYEDTNPNNMNYNQQTQNYDQDVPMEFTSVVSNNLQPSETFMYKDEITSKHQNVSMEFTQAVPASINVITSNLHLNKGTNNNFDGTQYFVDNQLELTDCVMDKSIQNTSMEFTMALPSVITQPHSNATKFVGDDDKTKVFQNVSMEMTVAVPVVLHGRSTGFCEMEQPNSMINRTPHETSNKTMVFHNESIEVTKPITTNIQLMHRDDTSKNAETRRVTVIENVPHSENERLCNDEKTKLLNTSMEMTRAISYNTHCIDEDKESNVMDCGNIHDYVSNNFDKIESDISTYKALVNVDKTRIYDNGDMDMTSAIIPSSQIGSNIQQNNPLVKNVPFKECYSDNIGLTNNVTSNINSMELMSDRTKIFHNNSMTFTSIVPSVNKKHSRTEKILAYDATGQENCTRTMVFPNMSMEVTTALTSLLNKRPVEASIHETKSYEELTLPEESEKENIYTTQRINQIKPTMNVSHVPLGRSTGTTSSLINSDPMLDQENCISPNSVRELKRMSSAEPLNMDHSSAKIRASITLHERLQEDTCASASAENNSEKPCFTALEASPDTAASAAINSMSNGASASVIAELNTNECELTPSLGKTDQLSMDNSYVANNRLSSKASDFGADDKENRAEIDLKIASSSADTNCNKEDHILEQSLTFCNENLEELESIKPPSFICLDDLSMEDVSVNNIDCHQEANEEINRIQPERSRASNIYDQRSCEEASKTLVPPTCEEIRNLMCNYQDYNLVRHTRASIVDAEITCKSQTFVLKARQSDINPDHSDIICEDRIDISEVQKLQLTCMNHTAGDPLVLECTKPIINDFTETIAILNNEESCQINDLRDTSMDVSNIENQSLHSPLSKSNEIRGDISVPTVEDSIREPEMEYNEQDCSVSNRTGTRIEKMDDEVSLQPEQMDNSKPAEKDASIILDPFSLLIQKFKDYTQSDDIIWDVYHENIERKMIVIGFISCSLLVVIFLTDDCDITSSNFIKRVKIISRLADKADPFVKLVHRLILEKIDDEKLMRQYENYNDILPMLDYISTEVKLALDFMFDVKRFEDLILLEINGDRISFVVRTKRLDIILQITMNVKPFDKIEPHDITVDCMLGSVREEDVKKLITNIKRDHKFLRRYINDVKDYIYLMEESSNAVKETY